MQRCIFSIIPPVFSVTRSFKNHNNMLICSDIINYYWCSIIIINGSYYNSCWKRKLNIFMESFSWFFDEQRCKKQHFFKTEINVTLWMHLLFKNLFIVSLLNKIILHSYNLNSTFKSWDKYDGLQNLCSIKCIMISIDNNNRCFLGSKSAYYYDFWRITWHWRLE